MFVENGRTEDFREEEKKNLSASLNGMHIPQVQSLPQPEFAGNSKITNEIIKSLRKSGQEDKRTKAKALFEANMNLLHTGNILQNKKDYHRDE